MSTYAEIAFTNDVKAAQTAYGTRAAYARMEQYAQDGGEDEGEAELGPHEVEFILSRDSFYQATVSATGWPYLQHRGGPLGFLQPMDSKTLAFADFAGNGQYISVGNLHGNDRISLFLMDYTQRRRLKILGRVKLVDASADPALIASLQHPQYRGRIQRAFVIQIEAFDWNCPQHIAPRYSQQEVDSVLQEFRRSIAGLQAKLQRATSAMPFIGSVEHSGPLELQVTAVQLLRSGVRRYEVQALNGGALPSAEKDAVLALPIRLPDGRTIMRTVGLDHAQTDRYSFTIQAQGEDDLKLHSQYHVGVIIYAKWLAAASAHTPTSTSL